MWDLDLGNLGLWWEEVGTQFRGVEWTKTQRWREGTCGNRISRSRVRALWIRVTLETVVWAAQRQSILSPSLPLWSLVFQNDCYVFSLITFIQALATIFISTSLWTFIIAAFIRSLNSVCDLTWTWWLEGGLYPLRLLGRLRTFLPVITFVWPNFV